jgi:hypothetical protein
VNAQFPGTHVSTETTAATARVRPPSLITRSSSGPLVAAIGIGGGGSQPDSGSSVSSRDRSRPRATKRTASNKKGIAGRRPVCQTLDGEK